MALRSVRIHLANLNLLRYLASSLACNIPLPILNATDHGFFSYRPVLGGFRMLRGSHHPWNAGFRRKASLCFATGARSLHAASGCSH